MTSRDPAQARAIWRRLELIHDVTYFAPEAIAGLSASGYKGFWMGYFAARSAPLGAAGPDVVGSLFYNFAPSRVRRALPDAWTLASPDTALATRLDGAASALRSAVTDVDSESVASAADLAARAATAASPDGRALFAANAALPVPDEPVERLWHAATLLREHRGDGHVAVLVANGISGREANVFQAAAGNTTKEIMFIARDYDEDEWSEVTAALAERGLLGADGAPTVQGRALHAEIERRTDELALGAYDVLSDEELETLTGTVTPIAKAVVAAGYIPGVTPMGRMLDEPTR